jgi:hypothetical protein
MGWAAAVFMLFGLAAAAWLYPLATAIVPAAVTGLAVAALFALSWAVNKTAERERPDD